MIIPVFLIFSHHLPAADCEPDLLTRSQLLLRFIRQASSDNPSAVAHLVAKAMAVTPLANPFEAGSPEFNTFEKFYKDVTTADATSARTFRHGLLMMLDLEESFHLSKILSNQEIPSARKH